MWSRHETENSMDTLSVTHRLTKWLSAPDSFTRPVSALVSAGAVGQVVLLSVMPLVTRLYTPADFGVAAVFGALMATLLMVTSLRYEMAIVVAGSDRQAELLVRLSLILNLASALAVLTIIAIWREQIAQVLGSPEISAVLWILPLALVGGGAYRIFTFLAVRRKAFGLVATTRIWQSIAIALTQVGAGFVGAGAVGLIASLILGSVVGSRHLARGTRMVQPLWKKEWLQFRMLARRFARFPRFDAPAALIDTLSVQLPNVLLLLFFGSTVAGWYLLADRAIVTPLSLIGQGIGQVIYSRSLKDLKSGTLLFSTKRVVKVLGIGVLLFGVIVVPSSPLFFRIVFGDQWYNAGIYASFLFFGFAAQFIYSSISTVLPATNGQHLSLFINLMLLTAKIAALCYGFMEASATTAIVAFSAVTFIGNVVAIGVVLWHLRGTESVRRNGCV